jgi:hypothetical protein
MASSAKQDFGELAKQQEMATSRNIIGSENG